MAAVAKKGRSRKALNAVSDSNVNISAGKASSAKPSGLATILSPQKPKRVVSKNKAPTLAPALAPSFADELQELQGRLQQLQLEKEKTDELLRERDQMLKEKEEEIENRGKEQVRLQAELKKLQKIKEFKPTLSLPLAKSLREEQEGKEEKKKKNKNCQERKKPCPAYVLWCRDQWNEVKKDNPEVDFKEMSNILGTKWKTLNADEKKPYEERYQKEKEVYLQIVGQEKREAEAMKLLENEQMQKTAMELLKQYLKFKQEADNQGNKTRKEKDPLKPKQPMSAFFTFSKERRTAMLVANKNVLEIAKIAGEEWKNMTEEQRAPYELIAKKQREEYRQQIQHYKQMKLEEAASLEKEEEERKKVMKQEALQRLKKKEKTENIIKKTKQSRQQKKQQKKEEDPNKPKKPASSFLLFSKEARKQLLEEHTGISNSTLNALISVKWKELTDAEKQIWNQRAAEGMAAYKREMEEYNKLISTSNNVQ